jgi:hypothetical protein
MRKARRHDQLVRQVGRHREKLRLRFQRNAQILRPARQLHQPVRLALRRAFGQRQAARYAKYLAQVAGLHLDLHAMLARHAANVVTQVCPRRMGGEKILANFAHANPIRTV